MIRKPLTKEQEAAKAAFPDGEFTREQAQELMRHFTRLRIINDQRTHFMLETRTNDYGYDQLEWRVWNFQPDAGATLKPYLYDGEAMQ